MPIKAIITDIEGTTSSLSFVKDVLFPYARDHLAEFVHDHGRDVKVREQLDAARDAAGGGLDDAGVVAQLIQWIDADRKITPLKALQGMIWENGYRQGHFRGHIYADAARNLECWHNSGIRIYVYSSGSAYAQQLLFAHTNHGDLNGLFSGNFDTRVGPKTEPDSYRRIVESVGEPAKNIVFLSDITAELDAARAVGLRTICLVREGAPKPDADHPQVADFDAVTRLMESW